MTTPDARWCHVWLCLQDSIWNYLETKPNIHFKPSAPNHFVMFVDDELDRMRQQMAETASLLASASYEQPQSQLQHYQVKLTEHLADPTQPLNLDMEGPDGEGQAAEAEPSPSAGRAQFSGLTDSPPRTPSQDAAGKAARAKRVASSREVCLLCRAVLC